MQALAIYLNVRYSFRFVWHDFQVHAPRVLGGWVVPAFVSICRFNQSQHRRFKAKRWQRDLWREQYASFGKFEPQQFYQRIERASVRVHIQHREIGPPKRRSTGSLTWLFAIDGIQHVRAAPRAVPYLWINFGVPRKRIFLPLIPRHLAVQPGERPDQGLIQ